MINENKGNVRHTKTVYTKYFTYAKVIIAFNQPSLKCLKLSLMKNAFLI